MKSVVKEFLELCIFKLSRKTGVPNSRIYFVPHTQITLASRKSDLGYNLFLDSGSATKCTFRNKTVLDK
jgi:hypothetical protein